jgi:hypothetical protein
MSERQVNRAGCDAARGFAGSIVQGYDGVVRADEGSEDAA